jgi:hypothetical protein
MAGEVFREITSQVRARSGGTHHPVKVIEVHWVPERSEWEMQARGVTDDGTETGHWVSHNAPEAGLAALLHLAHDIVTGG